MPHRLLCLGVLLATALGVAAASAEETTEQRDARMAWWREARFGMFIHWGLYAVPAGRWKGKPVGTAGEWLMFGAQIPVAEYEPLARESNPVKFDAAEWVRIAKQAGMKYIVITSKHHDGFCLWDSKLTDYDIVEATPFKRDVLKELARECRRQGLRMCWYHSILDWHHPDYLPRRPWDKRPTEGASYDRYIEHLKGQLTELLTGYGDIGVLWFDGGWEHSEKEHHAQEIVDLLRGLQPNIIINNRLGLPVDFDTPEQEIPATGIKGRDWETCMTMNDTWGYKTDDANWKSSEALLRNLVDITSKGGNFLLNVGPTAEGLIPQASTERLAALGRWLAANGESIYGTQASPFKRLPWGRCTRKPGKLFLHVLDWPARRLEVPGLRNEVKRAYLLAGKAGLRVARESGRVLVELPPLAPDPLDTVVVLEIAGEPEVESMLRQGADGSLDLRAAEAEIHGRTARYESGGERDNIGYWTDPADWVSWEALVDRPGAFRVEITYACDAGTGDSDFVVKLGETELVGKVKATGSWTRFVTEPLGRAELSKPGRYVITVAPRKMPGFAVMNLKAIRLVVDAP